MTRVGESDDLVPGSERGSVADGPTASRRRPRSAAPWAVVAASALAVGLASSPGFIFGYLAVPLQADLELDRWQVGLLMGVFFGATGLGSAIGGGIADRIGARAAVVTDQIAVAVAYAIAALVPHYAVLLVCAIVAGIGYALANTGTSIAIAAALPRHRHGVALAVRTAGVPLLMAISAMVAGALGESAGWRPVLAGFTPLLLVGGGLAGIVLPGSRRDARSQHHRASAPAPLPRGFVWFPLAACAFLAGSQSLFSWVVPFLHEAGQLPLSVAGVITSGGSLAGVAGMILIAQLSDRTAPTSRVPAVVLLCLLTAGGQLLLTGGIAAGAALMVAGLIIATVAELAAVSLMHAAVVAAAPATVGRASGLTMAGYYLGAQAGPALFGLIVDLTDTYAPAWLTCAALITAGAAAFWRCRRVGHTALPDAVLRSDT